MTGRSAPPSPAVLVAIVLAVNIASVRLLDRRRRLRAPMSSRLQGPLVWLLVPVTAAMLIFTLAPLAVTVAISFSDTAFVVFPPRGFTMRWYGQILHDRRIS